MEFVGARLKPKAEDGQRRVRGRKRCVLQEAQRSRREYAPFPGWVRPLAVRCISGHSSGAVDLQLAIIQVTLRVHKAIGGAWRMTGRCNLIWLARSGLLPASFLAGQDTTGLTSISHHLHVGILATNPALSTGSPTTKSKGLPSTFPSACWLIWGKISHQWSDGLQKQDSFHGDQCDFCTQRIAWKGRKRLLSLSLVDELVCESQDGEDYARATRNFVGKLANKFRGDNQHSFHHVSQQCGHNPAKDA